MTTTKNEIDVKTFMNSDSTLVNEMNQWLVDVGIQTDEIGTLHINDHFPALTSFVHYLYKVVDKMDMPFWRSDIENFKKNVKSEFDLIDFLNNYYYRRSRDVFKVVECIELYLQSRQLIN